MDEFTATVLVLVFLGVLAVFVIVASIVVLKGGALYRKIPKKSRPRRWLIAIFFSYFVVFCLWFPVWSFDRGSLIARVLTFVFGVFTAFIAAWMALGRIAVFLLPFVALAKWLAGSDT